MVAVLVVVLMVVEVRMVGGSRRMGLVMGSAGVEAMEVRNGVAPRA